MIDRRAMGARMRAARKRAGLSLEAVGLKCPGPKGEGVSPGAVAQWESGATIPDLENFTAFCSATKCPPSEVLGWTQAHPGGPADRLQALLGRLSVEDLDMAIKLISRLSPLSPSEKRFYKRAAKAK